MKLIVAQGQGHNFWQRFFRCQELVDFTVARAKAGQEAKKEADCTLKGHASGGPVT